MSTTWLRATNWRMMGHSVSTGNVVMAWTLLVISSITRCGSAPSSTCATTEALPSVAVETISLMPSML